MANTKRKETRGRKKVADKVVAVTAYIHQSEVISLGGMERAKAIAYVYLTDAASQASPQ